MEQYTSFDEYLIQGEPDKRHKAENWQIAIGLQAVDGLKPSAYLIETAQKHIEGELTIEEVKKRIDAYYETEEGRKQAEDHTDEADKVASNIADLLAEDAFTFSPGQYALIHRRLFTGIIKHAGEYRTVNISKREWALDGDSVSYTPYYLISDTLEYEFQQERGYKTKGENNEAIVHHLASFVSRIWQIHPFVEGNTRTTAIFTIKYLRKLGFHKANNDAFKLHSWYFRNALVRANYNNHEHGVTETTALLERFFDNLLFDAKHKLKNRYCHVYWENQNDQNSATVNATVSATVNATEKAVLTLIGENCLITYDEMATTLHKDRTTIYRAIKKLTDKGLLTRQGSDKSGRWVLTNKEDNN